ncbi:MAG: histidine kinase [Flavobacteriales bacterium]
MQIFRSIYIFTFLLTTSGFAVSQEYNYTHFTVEDGLPSSEVYSTFQDSKGYIWFATDAGVSRFNGYEFKNFDVKDGLTDNTVFLITEDSKGRVWFGTFNNKLCYYYNDSIIEFKHNDKLANFFIEKNQPISSFALDSNGTVWMGFQHKGLISCSKDGQVKIISDSQQNEYSHTIYLVNIGSNKVVFGGTPTNQTINHILKKNLSPKIDFYIKINGRSRRKITEWYHEKDRTNNIDLVSKDYNLVIINEDVYILKDDKIKKISIKELKGNRLYSCYCEQDKLWLCIENKGVVVYDLYKDTFKYRETFLEKIEVARVFKDKDNGYWFSTLKQGVYYMKSIDFKNYSFKPLIIKSMDIDTLSGNIFIGLDNKKILRGNLLLFNQNYFESIYECKFMSEEIKFNYFNSSLILGTDGIVLEILHEKVRNKVIRGLFPISAKSIIIDSNITYLGHTFGLSKRINNVETYDSYLEISKKYWCTSVIKQDSIIWMGTNEGLVKFNNNTHEITTPFNNHKILGMAITSLAILNKGILLIGTKSYGIVLVRKNTITKIFDKKNGLESNLIKCIHIDNQNDIWVGTNKGLSRLNYESPENFNIQNITTKHGLISNEISHIRSYKNIIYIATPKGLIEFDKTNLTINKTPSPIYITKFKVNDVEKDLKKNRSIELSYDENRIDIHFESLNYKSSGDINYKYRLLDADTTWQTTTQTTVSFYALPPNNYTFEVKAQNEDGFWSKPATYSFKINPPFWYTWWFISAEILFVLLVVVVIFKYRETQMLIKSQNLQKIAENEKKIIELELKALKSQMNPHFIFNTLNSIQHFILENKFKDSNRYISNFSKLIRMVLNHSDKNYITLREEIDMLNLYLGIEQVRFNHEFEHRINVSEKVDLDFDKIPPMLLQPFVENAIWHGLMNKNEKGRIEIDFDIEEDFLLCSVTDNGIGRKAAEEIKATRKIKNKSVGMIITKERLNIINNELYENMNVEVIDLYDSNNQASGTKIIVKIVLA